ncbi:SDR family NAD(P)-dependent oxidoreductase [Butyrivibrio sp. NC3005]|uniref:SDR family NAD(P)-dependent oxidoreductase n=1 Tax=Butyrivibrio sp. NC3005 TaxID=1280685 RepID=UPI000414C814|nr:SDR family NAD(P)-dependent oxidoreductase [Butyrivibrio sp. NC3005]
MANKNVLLTGASSGIGMEISKSLCNLGYEVYGIGRCFDNTKKELLQNEKFHKIECDLLDEESFNIIGKLNKENPIDILINNAGVAYYGLHEEINPSKIRKIIRTNVEIPMILTQMLLRGLKERKGMIINISSVTAINSANPHGAAYGASKAALLSFTNSLFEEVRKYEVKVTSIMPDMSKTGLYRNADFETDDDKRAYLEPGEVAKAVEYIVERPEGVDITQMVLRPQFHRIKRKKRSDKNL